MSDTMGFGIIGCGNIGPFHAEAISQIEDAELRASCDTFEEKSREMAAKYGGDSYVDYREMLKRKDINVVNICLPSGMHRDVAVNVADAGKHIVTEKPLDIALDKCDTIIDACKRNDVKLSVVFPTRFKESYQRMKRAVDERRFGKMVLGDAEIKWYRSQEYYDSGGWRGTWEMDGGGALMNQGVHTIDILQWLMGPVESVYAHSGTLARNIEVEDTAVALLRFANGAMGVIEGTTCVYPGLDARVGIHGEKGSVIVEGLNIKIWEFMDGKAEDRKVITTQKKDTSSGAKDPTKFIDAEGHRLQIVDMISAVRQDGQPSVDGFEGRKAVEIIVAIYKSAKEGKEIQLPL